MQDKKKKFRRYKVVIDIPLPQISDEEKQKKWDFLIDNFDVILNNFDAILNISNKKVFYTELYRVYLGVYPMGTRNIILGVLVLLWQKGLFMKKCPDCGGKVYLLSAVGSALSGTHSCVGYCNDCKKKKVIKGDGRFSPIWQPVVEELNNFPNKQIVLRTESQFFSWKYGIVGEPVPDKIIRKKIIGLDIEELIAELKSYKKTYN